MVSTDTAPHYRWGEGCDGWGIVRIAAASMLCLLVMLLGWMPLRAAAQVPVAAAHGEVAKENPAITALALKIYGQMRTGTVDQGLLTDTMKQELSPMRLALQRPILDQLGNPTKLTLESMEKTPYGTRWGYLAVFATAQLHVSIYVMADGKVGGYELAL